MSLSRFMCLLVISFGGLAFSASAAQAEPGAYWRVNGTQVSESLSPEVTVESNHFHYLTKVGLAHIDILCENLWISAVVLRFARAYAIPIVLALCKVDINGKKASACTPKSPGASAGEIKTNKLTGLIKLHEGGLALLEVVPEAGETIVTLELGASCAIGNKIDVKGKLFVKDASGEGSVNKVTHTLEPGPLTALLFGTNGGTAYGNAVASLSGAHSGMTFAGVPG